MSFQCADGASTPRSVEFPAGHFDIHAKLHAEFKGRCFWINHIHAGDGGDSSLTAQYVRFDDVQILGFRLLGLPRLLVPELRVRSRHLLLCDRISVS